MDYLDQDKQKLENCRNIKFETMQSLDIKERCGHHSYGNSFLLRLLCKTKKTL